MDARLQDLKRRLDELIAWCEEVASALRKNPDRQERKRLAAELGFISEEMKSINGEHHVIANDLKLTQRPAEG
jgi:hypothetical protein